MTWHAIKSPSGAFIGAGRTVPHAWKHAVSCAAMESLLYREWYKHDFPGDCAAACEAVGFRCVEVKFVEIATGDSGGTRNDETAIGDEGTRAAAYPPDIAHKSSDELAAIRDRLTLQAALEQWGRRSQIAMVAEEAAELAAAAMHVLREVHDGDNEQAFCCELADVEIMIDQMKEAGYAKRIAEARAIKMERLLARLAKAMANEVDRGE